MDSRKTCEGSSELIVVQSRQPQNIFKVTQKSLDKELSFYAMRTTTEVSESAIKLMIVKGNCCWKFYERYVKK